MITKKVPARNFSAEGEENQDLGLKLGSLKSALNVLKENPADNSTHSAAIETLEKEIKALEEQIAANKGEQKDMSETPSEAVAKTAEEQNGVEKADKEVVETPADAKPVNATDADAVADAVQTAIASVKLEGETKTFSVESETLSDGTTEMTLKGEAGAPEYKVTLEKIEPEKVDFAEVPGNELPDIVKPFIAAVIPEGGISHDVSFLSGEKASVIIVEFGTPTRIVAAQEGDIQIVVSVTAPSHSDEDFEARLKDLYIAGGIDLSTPESRKAFATAASEDGEFKILKVLKDSTDVVGFSVSHNNFSEDGSAKTEKATAIDANAEKPTESAAKEVINYSDITPITKTFPTNEEFLSFISAQKGINVTKVDTADDGSKSVTYFIKKEEAPVVEKPTEEANAVTAATTKEKPTEAPTSVKSFVDSQGKNFSAEEIAATIDKLNADLASYEAEFAKETEAKAAEDILSGITGKIEEVKKQLTEISLAKPENFSEEVVLEPVILEKEFASQEAVDTFLAENTGNVDMVGLTTLDDGTIVLKYTGTPVEVVAPVIEETKVVQEPIEVVKNQDFSAKPKVNSDAPVAKETSGRTPDKVSNAAAFKSSITNQNFSKKHETTGAYGSFFKRAMKIGRVD